VNDAVDRVILERQALDRGFSGGVLLSFVGHGVIMGGGLVLALLLPQTPPIPDSMGFAVEVPRGGGGSPQQAAPAPAAPTSTVPPQTQAPEPPQAPQQIIKPPKEEIPRDALPELDSKHSKKKATPPPPASGTSTSKSKASARPAVTGPGGTGTGADSIGISPNAPPGMGLPEGTSSGGDWYLASVQQRIWMIWSQQAKEGFNSTIGVTFTILADGTTEGIRITQPSGSTLMDLAAQRAVQMAGPFAPLPKDYGTTRYTLTAVFKPTD
jgi:TonB family protein